METVFQGLELIINLFDIFIFYCGAELFFTPVVKRKKYEFLIAALFLFTSKTILDWNNAFRFVCTLIPLLVLGLFLSYIHFSYEEKIKYKLIYILTYYIVMSLSELIMIALSLPFTKGLLAHQQILLPSRIIALMLSRVFMLLILILLRNLIHKNRKAHREISQMLLFILAINFILVFITFIIYNNITYLTKDLAFLVILISIFLMTILSIIVGGRIFLISEKSYEDSLQLQYMKAQEKHNEEMKIITQNLRYLRHDMNNHLALLFGLCDTKQYSELKDYLLELMEDMKTANDIVLISNNKILSVIVNNKKSLAQEKKIDFTYHIDSNELALTDMEICSLFGNIVDNAIEANEFLPAEQRWLHLSVKENEDGWIIICKNPFKEKPIFQNFNFVSNKSEPVKHGIGTKTMKRIIEQHGGTIDYHIKENQFLLAIFLPKEMEYKK